VKGAWSRSRREAVDILHAAAVPGQQGGQMAEQNVPEAVLGRNATALPAVSPSANSAMLPHSCVVSMARITG